MRKIGKRATRYFVVIVVPRMFFVLVYCSIDTHRDSSRIWCRIIRVFRGKYRARSVMEIRRGNYQLAIN